MILFASIGLCNVLCTYSMALQDSYNVLLHDKANYKVDLHITDDDYEMIGKHELKDFKIDNKNKIKLSEFKKIVQAANTKTTKLPEQKIILSSLKDKFSSSSTTNAVTPISTNEVVTPISSVDAMPMYPEEATSSTDDAVLPIYPEDAIIPISPDKAILPISDEAIMPMSPDDTFTTLYPGDTDPLFSISPEDLIMPIIVVTGHKKYIFTPYMGSAGEVHAINKRDVNTKENETEYDYDNFVDEYYEQENNESRSNDTYQISRTVLSDYGAINLMKRIFLLRTETENCTQKVNGIGVQAIRCLLHDFNNQRQLTKELSARIWKIIQIWFLVYLAIAVPVWCTRGWCCCCLRCKFFKPRQTIEEAKKYIITYPPGVFETKNGELMTYDPSPRERECYEEFEHFIKTL